MAPGCEKQKIIMCVGLFLCCDSILLYKIENTFRNIFRRGEGIMAAELKPIDVICQPSRDGKITPMKIRVIDEDGEYQEYKIKGYNIIMRNNIGLNKKEYWLLATQRGCLAPQKRPKQGAICTKTENTSSGSTVEIGCRK